MGMREKLIEFLWTYDQMRMMRMSIEECADHLIANGVTIPVRCKDCEYWENGKDYTPYCNHVYGMYGKAEENYFCSYGERRDGVTNG